MLLPSKTPTMLPFLKQNSYLRSCLSPLRAIFNTSICRLLSTASQDAPSASPASNFVVQYLINSCGLPSDRAITKSRYLPHLKSLEIPDAVLQFLRQAGITEPQIRAAALRDPRFLCRSVEKCFKPRIAELQEIGFSPFHISLLFSINPGLFSFQSTKLQQKIQFWMPIVGSVDKLLHIIKRSLFILTVNLETSVIPNLSFLQQQCSLSVRQIVQLISSAPRLITSSRESLARNVRRAEELGVPRSFGMFVHALKVVSSLKESTIDARLLYWRSLGFSSEELISCKTPQVLSFSENLIGCKMEFLIKEAVCDKLHVVQDPALIMYSLEKRLMPRIFVRKLLESKGFPVTKISVFMKYIEVRFVEKFVLPYEHAIPGLHQAYRDACSGNVSGLKFLQKTSS